MKIAFLLSCCFLSLAAHHLKYNSTLITPGQTFTVVVELDGQQIMHYDSKNMTMVPDTEWMKKVSLSEKNHWNTTTESMKKEKGDLALFLGNIVEYFNQQGSHSLSQIHGCQTNDENEKGSGFKWYSYDQKEFLRLNLNNITWIPADDKAQKYFNEKRWDSTKNEANDWKIKLEVDCINSLKLYAKYNLRQDPHKDKEFQQQPSSPDLDHESFKHGVIVGVVGLLVVGLGVVVGMLLWKRKKFFGFKPNHLDLLEKDDFIDVKISQPTVIGPEEKIN